MEGGLSFPRGVWTWVSPYMVVALLMHCLKSIGEMSGVGESNDSLVAFGMEMPLAGVDWLKIESMSL